MLKSRPSSSSQTAFGFIKEKVLSKIPSKILSKLVKFVQTCNLTLWGMTKPRNFVEASVFLTLYKDITGIGYNKLAKETSNQFGSYNSLSHNVKQLRLAMAIWARKNRLLWDL